MENLRSEVKSIIDDIHTLDNAARGSALKLQQRTEKTCEKLYDEMAKAITREANKEYRNNISAMTQDVTRARRILYPYLEEKRSNAFAQLWGFYLNFISSVFSCTGLLLKDLNMDLTMAYITTEGRLDEDGYVGKDIMVNIQEYVNEHESLDLYGQLETLNKKPNIKATEENRKKIKRCIQDLFEKEIVSVQFHIDAEFDPTSQLEDTDDFFRSIEIQVPLYAIDELYHRMKQADACRKAKGGKKE